MSNGLKETLSCCSRDLTEADSKEEEMDSSDKIPPRRNRLSAVLHGVKRNFVHEEDECSWEDLQRIEKIRRKYLRRREIPFFGIVLRYWEGTVLKDFFRDPWSYILLILYIVTRSFFYFDKFSFIDSSGTSSNKENMSLGVANIEIIGGFLTFFLIFYANYANDRVAKMYEASMGCEGSIFSVAALARSTIPRVNGLRLLRYLNAAHIAGYVGYASTYTYDNFFINANKAKGLLTTSEVNRMENICMDKGGSCYRELISWAIAEVTKAQQNGLVDDLTAHQYRELIMRLRGCIGTLYDYHDQPINFFYVHFVCLLSFLYLPLFTVETALSTGYTKNLEIYEIFLYEFISITTVFLQAIFVIGLRIMADRLSQPYGSDYEDLSVLHYVDFTWVMSRRMMEAEMPRETNLYEEEQMCAEASQSWWK